MGWSAILLYSPANLFSFHIRSQFCCKRTNQLCHYAYRASSLADIKRLGDNVEGRLGWGGWWMVDHTVIVSFCTIYSEPWQGVFAVSWFFALGFISSFKFDVLFRNGYMNGSKFRSSIVMCKETCLQYDIKSL